MANLTKEQAIIDDMPYIIKKIILSNYSRTEFSHHFLPYEAMILEVQEENKNAR
jgi:hypothetical protein